ncbi:MAG: glycosyltransferase family 2 protein [Wenzhouxiangellaceae bacterium]|nr:glycosyltransferase family 2 protein [Wenzhouxiangellaceae bacterium]
MNPEPALARVAVLIVNYNAGPWLARAVASLCEPDAVEPEIIVVDNGSRDDSLERLQATSLTIDRAGRNLGFAAGINRAARQTTRELLLLLNPDCRITPADLARLVDELDRHPEAALVSGRVVGEDGREQRASRRRLPTPSSIIGEILPFSANGVDLTDRPAPAESIEVEAVSGACMLVRRARFDALGGLDEGYPMHFEDLDLFARLQAAGDRLRWVPEVSIVHAGGISSSHRRAGTEIDKHRGLWRYLQRHCRPQWPFWQRPLWALALLGHLGLRLLRAALPGRHG